MPAISVGSVEVDVIPNASGIRARMQAAVVPAADEVGEEVGRVIGRHISRQVADAIRSGVTTGGRTAQAPAARQGAQTGSSFGRGLRTAVAAALRDLPEITLDADSTPAQREIAQIRAQMQTLMDVELGVDIDAGEALARLNQLQARLQRLSASDVDIDVRMDVGAASAQLAAFQAQVNRLDGQTAHVDVDTRSAAANLHLLATAGLALGPALIPVLPVVAAGLGAIAAAGVAAAAGVGAVGLVALPALKGIGSALQAQKAAQDAATTSTTSGGAAASQAASKALQLQGAQQSLAQAERNGARQIAQAQRQVVQAKRAAADAVAQAAQRNQQAARQVQDAERSLADAQRDARRAQEDLTKARQTARQELEDLNNQLVNSTLSQRDAEIALKEATLQRDAVLKSATSTELDKQKALLQYDQAVQRLKEQKAETKDLKVETAAANRAGVEGSDTVRSAQDRVAESQRAVADQARGLRDAQAEAARTQVETARQVADAQQKVGEATANVAVAQQNAADAVASAQRQIASASQSAAGGVDQAATAQAKYQAELAKLTPSARDTFDAFIDLRKVFGEWSKSLQPAVMPLFTRALVGMKNALPGLTPLVKGAADAIGGLQDRASRGFKKPWWKEFKADLDTSVGPAITGLGVAFGNIFKGMTGVIGAFLPKMDSISGRMQGITKRFANWGQGLKGSPEFEKFLSYSSEMGPRLGDAFGKFVGALLNIGKALAPVSGPLLVFLGGVAEAIGIIAEHAPWLVQGIWLAIVAWRIWTIAIWAWNAAISANPITLIILAIVALIAIGVWAFNKFPWFRNLVLTAWNGIKTASLWLWNTILKPFFTWFGSIVMWLWNTIIKPYIGFIVAYWKLVGQVIVWLWQKIVKPYIGFMVTYWRMVASVAMWLWKSIFAPVFKGIGAIISFWWTNVVKRYFGYVRAAIGVLGDFFKWLWQKAIKPAWNGISSVITGVWRNHIKPSFDTLKSAVGRVGDAFEAARKAIKTAWDRLKKIARDPVQYIVDIVYNKGIRGVWNKVAGAFGAKKLDRFSFASGGIMPGYTPGRDVHKFVSPTGGALELSGGEAIMRPEFTRAVGSGTVNWLNGLASSRGAQGVKAALAPVLGGNPVGSTDTSLRYNRGGVVQRFADGGIFGWIGGAANKVAGAGSAAWNKIKEGADWLKDTLAGSLRAGVKNVVDPLLKSFPGMDTGFGKMIRRIPTKVIDTLFGYGKKADKKGGGGGIGGPRIQAALKWVKTQNGLPYQWAGNGNPSWDCSGLMSAIESVIRGQKPHRRWATMAFNGNTAPPGWVRNGASAFKIGITNAGVGHTAGTLGKTKVESRGGDGVVVGSRARGYNDRLFNSWYGFQPGKYDSGGYLQPGLNLAYNGTGRPEPVFTTAQANALASMAGRGGSSGPMSFEGDLRLDSGEFLGRVRGEATAVMQEGQKRLIQRLNS